MLLHLIEPTKTHEQMIMEFRQEHIDNGEQWINGSGGLLRYDNFDEWLNNCQNQTSKLGVPATTYMSMFGDKMIGTIQLRHCLNERLERSGGHIGYGIRPSERGKGYGTQQLALVLNEAKKLKLDKVMISCDKDNIASAKVAINNGGVLTWEGYCEEDETDIQIYWLNIG